jgi:hypothetical protein
MVKNVKFPLMEKKWTKVSGKPQASIPDASVSDLDSLISDPDPAL